MDCVFCKIVSGKIPAKILKETKKSIAFLDAFPLTKGHTLVISKTHYQKIQDMSYEDNTDLFWLVNCLVNKVDKLTGSTLIAIHNGKEAGQEIPHIHIHIIPRAPKDSAGPVHKMFSPLKISDSEMEGIYNQLK